MTQLDRVEEKLDRLLAILDKPQPRRTKKTPAVNLNSFNLFWQAYPRKVGKTKARQAWLKHKLDAKVDMIIEDVQNRIESDAQWDNKQFIPHPTTYINGEQWNDELTPKPLGKAERMWRDLRASCNQPETIGQSENPANLDHNGSDLWPSMDRDLRRIEQSSGRIMEPQPISNHLGANHLRSGSLCEDW